MTTKLASGWVRKALKSLALVAAGTTFLAGAAQLQSAEAKERYALVIANKDYKHTGPVRFAFRDAAAIEKALVDTMGVPQQNIIFEKNLSKGALEYWFGTDDQPGQLSARVSGSDSELIVYFAGHGSKFDGSDVNEPVPYLLGTDTRPEALRRTGYSLNTLKANLRKIKKQKLTSGRVMLVLESCFSGSYNDGDLLTGRSAPAFGRPATVVTATEEKVEDFVVLAAAQGDQFAVWDNKWERSVFTDALVSGLYGEADDERFEGNSDGAVTLGELQTFVSKRIERRLHATGITARQDPVINGKAEMALVNTKDMSGVWPVQVQRSGNEKLEADILVQSKDVAGIQEYLRNCLYCFNKLQLKQIVREVQQSASICAIEERWLANVSGKNALQRMEAYVKTARCARLRPAAEARLVKLRRDDRRAKLKERRAVVRAAKLAAKQRSQAEADLRAEEAEIERIEKAEERKRIAGERAKERMQLAALQSETTTSDGTSTNEAATEKPLTWKQKRDAKRLLARRLQTELKRVGCLYGNVDGVWGRGSDGALDRFVKTAGVDVVGAVPSEEAIEAVAALTDTVCKAPEKRKIKTVKTRTRKAVKRKRKAKTRRKSKPKIVYEVIEEKPRKAKKRTRTKTTYKAPKKKYSAPKKKYRAPKKTYSSGGSSGGVTISRQCARYGNFC